MAAPRERLRQLGADLDVGPRRAAFVMVIVLLAFALVAFAWTALARVDVSVNARGSVIAPSRVQEVQSLEGGIVQQMLVQAGDHVRRGQPLAHLDTAQYAADLGESRQSMLAVRAARVRVDALLAGRQPDFGALEQQAPETVRHERQLWQDAQREYQAMLATAAEGVRHHEAERVETQTRLEGSEPALRVARESLAIEERLFNEGAGSRADYLAAQQRMLSQQSDLDTLRKSVVKLDAAVSEARAQGAEAAARARSQWCQQRIELEAKGAGLDNTVRGREDRVARRELLSPMDGVVNRVLIPTRGGVAAAGAPILEIVPSEEGLIVNARVKPADVGFIHVGQKATVRVLAYDFAIYGKLDALVERVGADALIDENKQPYVEVQLRCARTHLEHNGRQLAVTPGMPTDASILTGQRTVMQYLLKPVLKTFDSALQER